TYEYDVYANDNNHADLLSYGAVTGHDAVWGTTPLRAARGNVTRIGNWLKASGTYLYAYLRYDEVGNVVATKDPRGNVSSVSFADDFGNGDNPGGGVAGNFGATYAFPTLFTSPPPNPGGDPHTARAQYEFSRGTQTGFKDRNNIIAKAEYNDSFNRPTKVISAKGVAGVETHTSFYYAPNNVYGVALNSNDVMVVKDRDAAGDAILRSWTLTDGFGRTIEDWTRHPQGDVKVSTIYDPLGRVKQTSNPYRSSETPLYTTTTYDLAGRVAAVTTPGDATVSTAYDGERVMVTDPAQKKRISETDALGRLIKVWEIKPSDSATVSVNFPQSGGTTYHGYLTPYTFDVLDNLTNVAQGAQTRTFAYDSLKRLISATNPESGLITYVHDENGNLKNKTDARGITATFNYDALNRMTSDSYTSYPNGSSGSVFVYDNPDPSKNGKGRLWHNYNYATLPSGELKYSYNYIDAYDGLGRPTMKTQKFLTRDCGSCSYYTKDYAVTRTYDRAGNVKSQTYPSGRTVNYNYDIAGRLNEFRGRLGGTPADVFYAKDVRYNAWGQMTREEFGVNPGGHHTALYHRMYYNRRGQMFDTRLGTDGSSAWDVEDPLVWRWANGT
ncbi:MAG: hypothetical protein ACREAM_19575, partial [Blastocatellia bacterium]